MAGPIERIAAGAARTAPPTPPRTGGAAEAAPPVDGTAAGTDATGGAPEGSLPLDDTADVPEVLSTALARRAELLMLLARQQDQTQQAKLDRIRSTFDNAQEERSEQLREMNSLRDMAMEQMKKDDEILKKFIALI